MATAIFAYFSLTVFVIQPIGALPEGRTLVTTRIEVGSKASPRPPPLSLRGCTWTGQHAPHVIEVTLQYGVLFALGIKGSLGDGKGAPLRSPRRDAPISRDRATGFIERLIVDQEVPAAFGS
jgi:hypothetical protein